jgi:hypothetical protein
VQASTLCTNPSSSTCSGTITVTAGDLMVISVGTVNSASATCVTVSSSAGTRGDASYSAASGGTATAAFNGGGYGNFCSYSAIYYASVTSSGSDTITVTLSGTPTNAAVVVYEVRNALTPPTAASGTCVAVTAALCPNPIVTSSSLSVAANSFLVTAAADCPAPTFSNALTITAGPTGFTSTYGPNNPEYIGYQIPASAGSQSFQMTGSTQSSSYGPLAPGCWSVVGAQFVDPPPPPGWGSTVPSQATQVPTTDLAHQLGALSIPGVALVSAALILMSFVALVLVGRSRQNHRAPRAEIDGGAAS